MSITVEMKFKRPLSRQLKRAAENYPMAVGILPEDATREHFPPVQTGLFGIDGVKANGKKIENPYKAFPAGGTARKIDRTGGADGTIGGIFVEAQEKNNVNLLTAPLDRPQSRDIQNLLKQFFKILGDTKKPVRRLQNAVQALIRNPITRGDYGKNRRATAEAKGFDTLFVDTGQLFQAIKARVGRGV